MGDGADICMDIADREEMENSGTWEWDQNLANIDAAVERRFRDLAENNRLIRQMNELRLPF